MRGPDSKWPNLPSLSIPSRGAMRSAPLSGERVRLTPLEPMDAAELWNVVNGSRDYLQRWLPWVPFNTSLEASQRYADACATDWDAGRALRFGIREQGSGALLGVVGLDTCIHLHRSCDLGYWLKRDAAGKGIMTEAATLCVRFALRRVGVHRIRCAAATDNYPSLAVIARLNFRFEGIARCAEYVDGRWIDHAVFSRLSTDPE